MAKEISKGFYQGQAPAGRKLSDTAISSSKTPMPGAKLTIPKYKCRPPLQKGQKM